MKKTWYEPSVGVFWTGWSLFFRDRVSVHTGEEFHSSDCRHVYGIDILIFFSTAYVHITHTRIHAKPGTSSFFWNGIIDTKVLCDALKERKNFLFSGSFPNPILRHSNDSHMTSLFRCFETFSKYFFFKFYSDLIIEIIQEFMSVTYFFFKSSSPSLSAVYSKSPRKQCFLGIIEISDISKNKIKIYVIKERKLLINWKIILSFAKWSYLLTVL